jgi:hypothetical protein
MPYYTHDMGELGSKYKFVGGYSPSWAIPVPHYKVVDADLTARLIAGQTTSMANTARFSLVDSLDAHFELEPTGYDKRDESKAKAWFDTADARLARLIVKSFYIK